MASMVGTHVTRHCHEGATFLGGAGGGWGRRQGINSMKLSIHTYYDSVPVGVHSCPLEQVTRKTPLIPDGCSHDFSS